MDIHIVAGLKIEPELLTLLTGLVTFSTALIGLVHVVVATNNSTKKRRR